MDNLIDREHFNEFLECIGISEKDFANQIGVVTIDNSPVYLKNIQISYKETYVILGNLLNLKHTKKKDYSGIQPPLIFQGLKSRQEIELTFDLHTQEIDKVYNFLYDLFLHSAESLFVDLLITINAYGINQIIRIKDVFFTGHTDIVFRKLDVGGEYDALFRMFDRSKVIVENYEEL